MAPGARVDVDELARRLDVSPTPVREALAIGSPGGSPHDPGVRGPHRGGEPFGVQTITEHQAVVEALVAGDVAGAGAAMTAHLEIARARLLDRTWGTGCSGRGCGAAWGDLAWPQRR